MNALQSLVNNNSKLRSALRRIAGQSGTRYSVEVVTNAAQPSPTLAGEPWHYTTRGGTRIYHPSAYSRWGWSNMVYQSSTRRIEVDATWLASYLSTRIVLD